MRTQKDRKQRNQLATLSSVGLMFPISIALGYYLGSALDRWLGTGTKLMMLFVVLGVIGAFLNLYKEVVSYNRSTESDDEKKEKDSSEDSDDSHS